MRARYYDTGIGRFTTRDTYEGDYQYPLTLNRWMYVNGNPIVFTDPSGNFCLGGGSGPCSEYDDIPGYEGYDDYQNIPAYESKPFREFLWRTYGGYDYHCPSAFGGTGGGETRIGLDELIYNIFSTKAGNWLYDFSTSSPTGQFIYNNADDLSDLAISLLQLNRLNFRTDGHQYYVSGGPGSFARKENIGMIRSTTHTRIDNIISFVKTADESWLTAAGRNASAAMNSPWTFVGTAIDAFQDYHDRNYNPNDNGWVKYGTAVTYDFVANAASAAVSGVAYTAIAATAGAFLGAVGVASVAPALAIGAGIVGGAIVGMAAKNYIDNNYKEPIVNYVSHAAETAIGVVKGLFGG
jgi:hypothetical protein